MLRATTASLCTYCQRMRAFIPPTSAASTSTSTLTAPGSKRVENQHTVDALYELSVDVRRVRRLKSWVLAESTSYVSETADLLRDMGADPASVARVLEAHPEAVLCRPEDAAAQRDLWLSVCTDRRRLMSLVEKFPSSFFAVAPHGDNQRANVRYFQSLRLGRRVVGRLMAGAPQSFGWPVERNREVVGVLREIYLDLGGDEGGARTWLRELLGRNPDVLTRPVETWKESLAFLREQGFAAEELVELVSSFSASMAEPEAMRYALAYVEGALGCTKEELRDVVLRCPAVLNHSLPTLIGRLQALMDSEVGAEQIKECPGVLELATQVVLHRVRKLESYGYDVRWGSLDVVVGTEEDFERSCGKLRRLRRQRPLFDAVAPLVSVEE